VLFADIRYPEDKGARIEWNRVFKNRVIVSSGKPSLVTASAIELTDTRDVSAEIAIENNDVVYNDLRGSETPFEFTPDDLEGANGVAPNHTGPGSLWPDSGPSAAKPAATGGAPVR
jgi:hypothetical protein